LASDTESVYTISTPELPISIGMAGSGDITTSMFLGRLMQTKNIQSALELCTASIYSIIENSWIAHNNKTEKTILMELQIIAEQDKIVNPTTMFKVKKI
jgi:pyridoxine kinase